MAKKMTYAAKAKSRVTTAKKKMAVRRSTAVNKIQAAKARRTR